MSDNVDPMRDLIVRSFTIPSAYWTSESSAASAYADARKQWIETTIKPRMARLERQLDFVMLIELRRIEAYRMIENYAKAVGRTKHMRFRVERKLKRWWSKQIALLAAAKAEMTRREAGR